MFEIFRRKFFFLGLQLCELILIPRINLRHLLLPKHFCFNNFDLQIILLLHDFIVHIYLFNFEFSFSLH